MHPAFSPPLLTALARIRAALRECGPSEAMLVYQVLLGMAMQTLNDAIPPPPEGTRVGQPQEVSQPDPDEALTACQCARLSGWKRSAPPGERAGFSPRWFYDHADELPFRIGGRGRRPVRFSRRGYDAWFRSR